MSVDGIELGKIDWLDIREVWKHEASDFTPWLLENTHELAAALGIELELEQAEHAVGSFSLDLIGRDLAHDCRLIVENQIEQSDHGHLPPSSRSCESGSAGLRRSASPASAPASGRAATRCA